uniref:Uncharacterized protein n=1 Tax=Vitis vinifera TaxID=29760 RepID=A5B583_VITVI|nr:hypothetical protein VITISV_019808 [Vitis vinifera]
MKKNRRILWIVRAEREVFKGRERKHEKDQWRFSHRKEVFPAISGTLGMGRILSGQHSTSSGYLTSGILSADIPSPPDISHLEFSPPTFHLLPDISHPEFYPPTFHLLRVSHIRNSVRPTFHLLRISHIWNSVRRHSTSSGYLTFGILFGQRSISSRYLTSEILSANVPPSPDISHPEFCPPTFHLLRIFHIRRLTPDGIGGRFNFPGQTCPDPQIALTRRASAADNSKALLSMEFSLLPRYALSLTRFQKFYRDVCY